MGKQLIKVARVTLVVLFSGLITGLAHANRGHFMIEDAAITPPSTCALESWWTRGDDQAHATVSPLCNFTGESEWSMAFEYDTRNGETTALEAQYKTVLFNRGSGPVIALAGGGRYERASSELSDLYLTIPFSLQVLDRLTLHLNGGVLHDRVLDDTYGTWGLAGTFKTISGPQLIAEFSDNDRYDPTYGVGARFTIGSTRWTLDLGATRDTHWRETAYTLGVNIPRLF